MAVATRTYSLLTAILLSIVLAVGGGGTTFGSESDHSTEAATSLLQGEIQQADVTVPSQDEEACGHCCSPYHCLAAASLPAAATLAFDFTASLPSLRPTAPLVSNSPRGLDRPPKRLVLLQFI